MKLNTVALALITFALPVLGNEATSAGHERRVPREIQIQQVSPDAHECTTRSLACNTVVTGTVNGLGCRTNNGGLYNVYRFFAEAGQTIRIDGRSDSFPPLTMLHDSAGSVLASSEGAQFGPGSPIFYDVTVSSPFVVTIGGQFILQSGTYSLSVECATVPSCRRPAVSITGSQLIPSTPGREVRLSVGVEGTGVLRTIWYDGPPQSTGRVVGEGPAIIVTPRVTTTYYAQVSNSCGSAVSLPITVQIPAPSRRRIVKPSTP